MALEVVNDGTAHPARLEATIKYLRSIGGSGNVQDIGNALMPSTPSGDRAILSDVLKHLKGMDVISEKNKKISLSKIRNNVLDRDLLLENLFKPKGENNHLFSHYYAWLIYRTGEPGSENFTQLSPEKRASMYNEELNPNSDDRKFNDTKERSFRTWAMYLGLGHLTVNSGGFLPMPLEVVERVLVSKCPADIDKPAKEILKVLSKELPFIDGGAVFTKICKILGTKKSISPTLSACLRILHDENRIRLKSTTDAPNQVQLSTDRTHKIQRNIHSIAVMSPKD